jgi:hypothetical protein
MKGRDTVMGTIIFQIIIFGLIALFVISFTLFVRRLLVNSTVKNNQLNEIGNKLDRMIELLEREGK